MKNEKREWEEKNGDIDKELEIYIVFNSDKKM